MNDDLFRFSIELEVRWRDVDALNHVNNAVYFTYLEQARVHYVRELGIVQHTPTDVGFILGEAYCRFRSPLALGERVTVWARTSELRRSSFVFEYRLEGDDGRLVATARTVQVCYDYDDKHSVPLSDEWRRAIIEYEPGLSSEGRDKILQGG